MDEETTKKKKASDAFGSNSVGSWLEEMIRKQEGRKPIPDLDTPPRFETERETGGRILKEFIPSVVRRHRLEPLVSEAEVLASYGNVVITRVAGEPTPIYQVRMPPLTPEERKELEEIKERAITEIALDPEEIVDVNERRSVFAREVRRIIENDRETRSKIPVGKLDAIIDLIVSDMIGYGPLDPLIADPNLEEVMVISHNKPVYVYHIKHGMCKTNIVFEREKDIRRIIERIGRQVGRRIDQQSPLLDARLPDGSRVNATIPPVSIDGPTLTIRKFRQNPLTAIDLIDLRTMSTELAAFLWLCVDGLGVKPANILVSGGTASGKTTLLNTLVSFIPHTDRVLSIEDTAELQLPLPHWIRFETRPPNIEGRGEITMDDLVKNSLRMRPDRIIVGEVRGPEARTLFTGINTGHDGCMGTIHANTAHETITRLLSPPMSVPEIMLPALDLIIMQSRIHSRTKGMIRRVSEVAEVTGMESGKVQLSRLYKWNPKTDTTEETGVPSEIKQKIANFTGQTGDELNIEIKRRELVLDWMRSKRINNIYDFCDVVQEYYLHPDRVLERVQEDGFEGVGDVL